MGLFRRGLNFSFLFLLFLLLLLSFHRVYYDCVIILKVTFSQSGVRVDIRIGGEIKIFRTRTDG